METRLILLIVYEMLWLALTALNVADVVTTNQFLKQSTATEGDQISAFLQAALGGYRGPWWIVKLAVILVLQFVGVELYRLFYGPLGIPGFGLMILLLATACAYYWTVVMDNVAADRRQS